MTSVYRLVKVPVARTPMRVEASEVASEGVQVGSLDQLKKQQPGESGLHLVSLLVHLLIFCADLFCVPEPKCYKPPCECPDIR